MNKSGQITVRQWFRLPKRERQRLVTEFRAADAALQACEPPGGDEDATYFRFHDQFSELWPTVPWWCRL